MMTVELPASEVKRLDNLCREMVRATGREMTTVARNAGRDLVFAGIRNTPLAPKSQKMEVKGEAGKYWVVLRHRHTGETMVFKGTAAQARLAYGSVKSLVKNRGFAKAGWLACLVDLGITPRANYPGGTNSAANYAQVLESLNNGEFSLLISNMIPFIEDFDKGRNQGHAPLHILEKSMSEVSGKMEGTLQRMADKLLTKLVVG